MLYKLIYEMAYKIAKENGNWSVKNQCDYFPKYFFILNNQ